MGTWLANGAVGGDAIHQALLDRLPEDGRFVYTSGLKADGGTKSASRVLSISTVLANVPHLRKLWAEAELFAAEGVIKVLPKPVALWLERKLTLVGSRFKRPNSCEEDSKLFQKV